MSIRTIYTSLKIHQIKQKFKQTRQNTKNIQKLSATNTVFTKTTVLQTNKHTEPHRKWQKNTKSYTPQNGKKKNIKKNLAKNPA